MSMMNGLTRRILLIGSLFFCIVLKIATINASPSLTATCGSDIDFDTWLTNSPSNKSFKLIQSQAYIRHGDRTIADASQCFNNDTVAWNCSESLLMQPFNFINKEDGTFEFELKRLSNTEYLAGDCMIGQLTSIGYKQHLYNGEGLHKRYMDTYLLLPNIYSLVDFESNTITLRADNEPRTQHSAMALFTGMYDKSTQGNTTQHVYLETQDEETEILLPNADICPNYETNLIDGYSTNSTAEHYSTITLPLLEQVNTVLANPGYSIETLFNAFDCMTVYICHNKKLPSGLTQSMYDSVVKDISWYQNEANYYPNRINASTNSMGPLLKLTLERFTNMVNSKGINNDKFYLYSGHDTGPMIPMLGALGYNLTTWTPYASLITLELYEKGDNTNDYYIMASYNGQILTLPSPCDSSENENSLCSWDKFQEFMNQMIPTVDECPGLDLHGTVSPKKRDKTLPRFGNIGEKKFDKKKN